MVNFEGYSTLRAMGSRLVGTHCICGSVLIGITGGVAYSKKQILCTSCHEMRLAIQTWRVSSHKDVACGQCHLMPGIGDMIRAKISKQNESSYNKHNAKLKESSAHILNANCENCHTKTAETIVYHSLKISHKKHLERGIECTFCHANVVHGPNAAVKNIPKMSSCLECHDGSRASNSCELCHETFGARKSSNFSSDWIAGHKREVANDITSCKQCHKEDFCQNCHQSTATRQIPTKLNIKESKLRAHPSGWIKTHSDLAKKNPSNCKTCHAERFCIACHQEKIPASHSNSMWFSNHGKQIAQDASSCIVCHKSAFCLKCHATQPPSSHNSSWIKRHPAQAVTISKVCETCHTKDYCRKCHGLDIPHPSNWQIEHRSAAMESRQICRRCHQDSFCTACHRSSRPKSHTSNWIKMHGSHAADKSACYDCHIKQLCQSCHTSTLPNSHKGNWLKTHGKTAKKDTSSCLVCHTTQNCSDCHKVEMPHKPNWLMGHKDSANYEPTACIKCHDPSDCTKCHSTAPASHTDEFKKKHSEQGKSSPGLCDLCHSKDSCQKCHGVEMPHPPNFIMEHKKHGASLAQSSPCFKCHEEKYCRMCHPSK